LKNFKFCALLHILKILKKIRISQAEFQSLLKFIFNDLKMYNFIVKDVETCHICNEYMGNFKNEFTVVTGYSETPLYKLWGKQSVNLC
jgi:hypothetical protein